MIGDVDIKEVLKNFINTYKSDINRGDFDYIYKTSFSAEMLNYFTLYCFKLGLTPGKMFKNLEIPNYFYTMESDEIKSLDLSKIISLWFSAFIKSGIKEYLNASDIVSVSEKAFKQAKVKSIMLENVSDLGEEAFSHCAFLETFPLIETTPLVNIPTQAFASCTSLKEITIPDATKVIGDRAFSYCMLLDKVSIPGALETTYDAPFVGDIIKLLEIRGTKEDWERIQHSCPELLRGTEIKRIICTK